MAEIRDFICDYSNSVGISAEVTEPLGLEFPDAYTHRETLATLAKAVKEYDHAGFCLLPFCRTLEVEAMGADINMGNANTGPRARNPICTTAEEMLALPEIDLSQGRIRETLEACRILAQEGEHVCLEIVGPWTMMTSLMDASKVFKMYRKQPEETIQIMNKLGDQLLKYVDEARECGVEIITYSDSAGTLNILGPKLMERSMHDFNAEFVKKLVEHIDDNMVIQLCPKIAYALIDTGLAEVEVIDLGGRVDFLQALLDNRKQAKVVGQMCIKNIGVPLLNGKLRSLKVK